jgi:hypothetical protein
VDTEIADSLIDPATRVLGKAIALLASKNYVEALNVCKSIIETPELSSIHGMILSIISSICITAQTDGDLGLNFNEIFAYLKAHTKDDKNAPIDYKITYAGALTGLGWYEEALSEFEAMLELPTINDGYKQRILGWLNIIRYGFIEKDLDKIKLAELLGRVDNLEKKLNNSNVVSVNNPTDIPIDYSLSQNYPNPFNPTTIIQYSIPKDEFVKLTVYDITGKVVKELVSGHKAAGRYSVEFNASSYSSGIYYYKLEAGQYNTQKKMMLIK